jgi:hypothetical protein
MAKETMLSKMGKVDAQMNKIFYSIAKLVNHAKELVNDYPVDGVEVVLMNHVISKAEKYMDDLHIDELRVIHQIEMLRVTSPTRDYDQTAFDFCSGVEDTIDPDTGEITANSNKEPGNGAESEANNDVD